MFSGSRSFYRAPSRRWSKLRTFCFALGMLIVYGLAPLAWSGALGSIAPSAKNHIVIPARFQRRVVFYPEMARDQSIKAIAIVCETITIHGGTKDRHLCKSSGVEYIDRAALLSAANSVYAPGTTDGRATEMAFRAVYVYNEEAPYYLKPDNFVATYTPLPDPTPLASALPLHANTGGILSESLRVMPPRALGILIQPHSRQSTFAPTDTYFIELLSKTQVRFSVGTLEVHREAEEKPVYKLVTPTPAGFNGLLPPFGRILLANFLLMSQGFAMSPV